MNSGRRLKIEQLRLKDRTLAALLLAEIAASITCILGSNGADKSTLIRSILRLTPPRSGSISFNAKFDRHLETHQIVKLYLNCIPEAPRIFAKMTVEENLRTELSEFDRRERFATVSSASTGCLRGCANVLGKTSNSSAPSIRVAWQSFWSSKTSTDPRHCALRRCALEGKNRCPGQSIRLAGRCRGAEGPTLV